jgi:hypothetical protein
MVGVNAIQSDGLHPGRNFWRRQRFWKKNTLEAVNGLTSDDEDTVNGAFGPLEQPR